MGDKLIDWIKKELEIRKLSQRSVAKKANISHAYFSDVLRGVKPITRNFCFAVSTGMNEPIWKILGMTELMNDVPQELLESEEIKMLILKFNKLSEYGKNDVLRYIDYVIIREQ